MKTFIRLFLFLSLVVSPVAGAEVVANTYIVSPLQTIKSCSGSCAFAMEPASPLGVTAGWFIGDSGLGAGIEVGHAGGWLVNLLARYKTENVSFYGGVGKLDSPITVYYSGVSEAGSSKSTVDTITAGASFRVDKEFSVSVRLSKYIGDYNITSKTQTSIAKIDSNVYYIGLEFGL